MESVRRDCWENDMRLSRMAALGLLMNVPFQAFASDDVQLSIAMDAVKFGYGKETSKPVDSASTTNSAYYADILGSNAESNSVANVEVGIRFKSAVFYLFPLENAGQREFWVGQALDDDLEWGFVTGGFSKTYNSPVTTKTGQKLKSEGATKLGAFVNKGFKVSDFEFEANLVPYFISGKSKYEQSISDESSAAWGVSGELMHSAKVAKNMSIDMGLSLNWMTDKKKINDKDTQTDTILDIGFYPARFKLDF